MSTKPLQSIRTTARQNFSAQGSRRQTLMAPLARWFPRRSQPLPVFRQRGRCGVTSAPATGRPRTPAPGAGPAPSWWIRFLPSTPPIPYPRKHPDCSTPRAQVEGEDPVSGISEEHRHASRTRPRGCRIAEEPGRGNPGPPPSRCTRGTPAGITTSLGPPGAMYAGGFGPRWRPLPPGRASPGGDHRWCPPSRPGPAPPHGRLHLRRDLPLGKPVARRAQTVGQRDGTCSR